MTCSPAGRVTMPPMPSSRAALLSAGPAQFAAALVPAAIDGPFTPWLDLLGRLHVAVPSAWQVDAGVVAWRVVWSMPRS